MIHTVSHQNTRLEITLAALTMCWCHLMTLVKVV